MKTSGVLVRALAAASLVTASCAGQTPAPPTRGTPAAPAAPATAAATEPADPLAAELNLSFEPNLDGWSTRGDGYVLEASAEAAHAGASGLHLMRTAGAPGTQPFCAASRLIPVEKARGQLVHLSGWIRTRDVGNFVGLWLRADGPKGEVLGFDNMERQAVKGTNDWKRYQIDVAVPVDAKAVVFGALLAGDGEAWVDDLRLSFEAPRQKHPVAVGGRVRGPDGATVQGATVAAVPAMGDKPAAVATTDAAGSFTMTIPSGDYAFTATGGAGVAAYLPVRTVEADGNVELQLGSGGFALTGRVRSGATLPPEARLLVTRMSEVYGDIFITTVDATGTFHVRLPEAMGYFVDLDAVNLVSSPTQLAGKGDQSVTIDADLLAPAPDEVVAWVKKAATPLRTTEAGNGFDDMAPVANMVAGARIVALGEATHGTREFFQLKHRLLEYLVEKQGFTLFAIEANLPEARRINDYVLDGKGDAEAALAGIYFWTWDTEEVLAQIQWMRAYNANPGHKKKVQFFGFDMQTTKVAWPNVKAYLGRVDAAAAAALPAGLDFFAGATRAEAWKALPDAQRKETLAALDAVVARLDARAKDYVGKSSTREWRAAREDARVVSQAAHMFDATNGFEARDVAMAENIGWILDHEAKGAKMVVWAHNGHIANEWQGAATVNMGSHLLKKYGKAYTTFGFVFEEGSFQAMGGGEAARGLREWTLGPAHDTDVSMAFARAGCELCVLDLRTAPGGPIADWFAATHLQRETGAVFSNEENMTRPVKLSRRFNVVVFVHKTTRSRPLAAGKR